MKHFTRTEDLSKEEYLEIFRRMEIFKKGIDEGKDFTDLCPGKVIATMFFQESTRTSASLKAAMIRLGGGWFGMDGIKGTYLESGEEDLEDTLNGVAPICDIMAIRHKSFDLTEFAEKGFRVPLINAMCGSEEHSIAGAIFPYMLLRRSKSLNGLKVGIYGMTKSSRPMKAAVKVLSYFGVEFYEDSVIDEFTLPQKIKDTVIEHGSKYIQDKLDNFIDKVDFLFVIEGLPQSGEDENLVNKFNKAFVPISNAHLARIKKETFINVDEPRATTDGRLVALKETDGDPRMISKDLMELIVHGNMALITYLLGIEVK